MAFCARLCTLHTFLSVGPTLVPLPTVSCFTHPHSLSLSLSQTLSHTHTHTHTGGQDARVKSVSAGAAASRDNRMHAPAYGVLLPEEEQNKRWFNLLYDTAPAEMLKALHQVGATSSRNTSAWQLCFNCVTLYPIFSSMCEPLASLLSFFGSLPTHHSLGVALVSRLLKYEVLILPIDNSHSYYFTYV